MALRNHCLNLLHRWDLHQRHIPGSNPSLNARRWRELHRLDLHRQDLHFLDLHCLDLHQPALNCHNMGRHPLYRNNLPHRSLLERFATTTITCATTT